MTYRLNICILSGTFEKSFGLPNFANDYAALVAQVNDSEYMQCFRSDIINKKLYKLFCKLSHFFDNFNAFINKSIAKRTEHNSKHLVDRRLSDFIRRIESMKIPRHIQNTIVRFLKAQRKTIAAQKKQKREAGLQNWIKEAQERRAIRKKYPATIRAQTLKQLSYTWEEISRIEIRATNFQFSS